MPADTPREPNDRPEPEPERVEPPKPPDPIGEMRLDNDRHPRTRDDDYPTPKEKVDRYDPHHEANDDGSHDDEVWRMKDTDAADATAELDAASVAAEYDNLNRWAEEQPADEARYDDAVRDLAAAIDAEHAATGDGDRPNPWFTPVRPVESDPLGDLPAERRPIDYGDGTYNEHFDVFPAHTESFGDQPRFEDLPPDEQARIREATDEGQRLREADAAEVQRERFDPLGAAYIDDAPRLVEPGPKTDPALEGRQPPHPSNDADAPRAPGGDLPPEPEERLRPHWHDLARPDDGWRERYGDVDE